MRYYKLIDSDNYIASIGIGFDGEEIAIDEYNELLSLIKNRPTPKSGYDYKLKADLTWEQIEIEVIDPEQQEISSDEALDIILGGVWNEY